MTVICLPTLKDFVRELVDRAPNPTVYLQSYARNEGARDGLLWRIVGVRLTAEIPNATLVWYWERGYHYTGRGEADPIFDPKGNAKAYQRVAGGEMIHAALAQAGVPEGAIRAGGIAIPNNLSLVMGDADCLKWSTSEDGTISVEINPNWLSDL